MQAPDIGHENTWWKALENALVREAGGEPHPESYGERYVKEEVKLYMQGRAQEQVDYVRNAKRKWDGGQGLLVRNLYPQVGRNRADAGQSKFARYAFDHPKEPLLVS